MAVVDVEKEFATCVRSLGGSVLGDQLVSPSFSNADYWFPGDLVIGELKCLSEDFAEKGDFKQRLSELYVSWLQRRLVPPSTEPVIRFNLQEIPEPCAYEFLEIMKKRIEFSTIKKANKQIRETKHFLNAPDAKGLLLLANDGNLAMKPEVMAHLLARILKGKYSSIDSVIYFSVNHPASASGVPMPSLFWIDAIVPEREPVELTFRHRLRDRWFAHYSAQTSEPVYEVLFPNDPNLVEHIRFKSSGSVA